MRALLKFRMRENGYSRRAAIQETVAMPRPANALASNGWRMLDGTAGGCQCGAPDENGRQMWAIIPRPIYGADGGVVVTQGASTLWNSLLAVVLAASCANAAPQTNQKSAQTAKKPATQ